MTLVLYYHINSTVMAERQSHTNTTERRWHETVKVLLETLEVIER